MPVPQPAIEAAAWVIVADILLVSAFAAAYAARIVRTWTRKDQ